MKRTALIFTALATAALVLALPAPSRAQDETAQEADDESGNELAELELAREKALADAEAENAKEAAELEKQIAEKGLTNKLRDRRGDLARSHAGNRMRIEREFAEKRRKALDKKRGAVARDLSLIEDERDQAVRGAEEEFDREIEAARKKNMSDEAAFENERARLRKQRNEKVDKIEQKFGEKRRKLLEKKGKLHPHDAEDNPGKGGDGERGNSEGHRQDEENRGHGRDKKDDDDSGEGKGKEKKKDKDDDEHGNGNGKKK